MNISLFELLFFLFVACAWPLSIVRMIRNKSTHGKSLLFSCIALLGYTFGIIHKCLYHPDAVVYAYILTAALVLTDTLVFVYVRHRYEKKAAA